MKCTICNDTKHITFNGKLVRCECLLKEIVLSKLEKYLLGDDILSVLEFEGGKIKYKDCEELKLVNLIEQKIVQKKKMKHTLVIDLSRDISYYSILAALLILKMEDKVSLLNMQTVTDDVFQNRGIELNKVNLVVNLSSLTKNLNLKLIQNIYLRSKIESKITLFVFSDYKLFKRDNPEIVNVFDNIMLLPDATYR